MSVEFCPGVDEWPHVFEDEKAAESIIVQHPFAAQICWKARECRHGARISVAQRKRNSETCSGNGNHGNGGHERECPGRAHGEGLVIMPEGCAERFGQQERRYCCEKHLVTRVLERENGHRQEQRGTNDADLHAPRDHNVEHYCGADLEWCELREVGWLPFADKTEFGPGRKIERKEQARQSVRRCQCGEKRGEDENTPLLDSCYGLFVFDQGFETECQRERQSCDETRVHIGPETHQRNEPQRGRTPAREIGRASC